MLTNVLLSHLKKKAAQPKAPTSFNGLAQKFGGYGQALKPTLAAATIGVPIVGPVAVNPYEVEGFDMSKYGASCPGCSTPQDSTQAYPVTKLSPPTVAMKTVAPGVVDVNVDTSPIMILGLLALAYFAFRK